MLASMQVPQWSMQASMPVWLQVPQGQVPQGPLSQAEVSRAIPRASCAEAAQAKGSEPSLVEQGGMASLPQDAAKDDAWAVPQKQLARPLRLHEGPR